MRSFMTSLLVLTSATFVFAHTSSVSTVAPSTDPVAASPPRGPLPARKHRHSHHKKTSAATSRAKRTPQADLPLFGDDEEGSPLDTVSDMLPVDDLPSATKRGLLSTGSHHSTTSLLDLRAILKTCSLGMSKHQANIEKAARRARNNKGSRESSPFQNSVYQELKAYRGSAASLPGLKALDSTLKPLGPDQGWANFNRDDPVQVLLRTSITSLEDTLEAVNLIVFHIPILGAVLGPIVYDIKCIIDDVLNAVEVVVDGLLNNLSPQLTILSGNYLTSTCKMGPSLPVC